MNWRTELQAALPASALALDRASLEVYGYDNSKRHHAAEAVVFAHTIEQVQTVVQICARHQIPLTARGRGTATTGAAVPIQGGIVLSFERMAEIIEIDPQNRLACVQPGVLNGSLQSALSPFGFFWPPDPTSAAFCSIGGNLACNAGGPRTVKYGATRDNVLGLSFVDGRGNLIRTGTLTSKGAVGYDLTRLLIGAEGTLGLIVEATLKLTPLPETRGFMRLAFSNVESAALAVSAIMAQPHTPSALEFLDEASLNLVRQNAAELAPVGRALLLIEVDGFASSLAQALAAIDAASANAGRIECLQSTDSKQGAALWAARKALSPKLRAIAPKKINEDVVVPVAKLPLLIAGVNKISHESGIPVVNFGHAGNGNIHVNFLYDPANPAQAAAAPKALADLFSLVLHLGGTLSGEHGIGLDKLAFVKDALDPGALSLMRAVKAQFDPRGILNPGKVLP